MSVTWGLQRGDPSALALKLELATDPDRGRGADPDVAASWGTFSLWAGGVNVTAFSDGQETHPSVNRYLLPVLEWLAEGWDPLFHEERLPCRVAGDDAAASLARTAFPPSAAHETWEREWQRWWHRHALQSARYGGPFPDVVIRRWRDQVEVSWRSLAPAGVSNEVRFLAADGHARCDAAEATRVIYDVAVGAVTQLRQMRPDSPRLLELERRFEAIPVSEDAPRLSWLAGLGSRYDQIMATVETQASSVADLFAPNTGGDRIVSGSCISATIARLHVLGHVDDETEDDLKDQLGPG